jgi:tripartite-type tricarboxylate transporter receptor subunit TctC
MQLLLQDATGTEFTIVDCGGVADTITNLVGGMVDMAILPINNASQYVESGDLKALAITGNNKSLLLPDVPTMKECGFESCEIPSISVLVGPQGMSQDDVTKINAVMKEVLENPDIVEKYNQMAMTAGYHTVEEAVAIVDEMQEKYNKAAEMMN